MCYWCILLFCILFFCISWHFLIFYFIALHCNRIPSYRIASTFEHSSYAYLRQQFQLFGNPESEPGDSLVGVYNYLINVTSTVASGVPFPKQYGPWKEGGYLYEPLEGGWDWRVDECLMDDEWRDGW